MNMFTVDYVPSITKNFVNLHYLFTVLQVPGINLSVLRLEGTITVGPPTIFMRQRHINLHITMFTINSILFTTVITKQRGWRVRLHRVYMELPLTSFSQSLYGRQKSFSGRHSCQFV